jgi:hypothetical protein
MLVLAGALILIGVVAAVVALGTLIHILPHARPQKDADWMTVLLRSYKPHIIAYFVLLAVSATALGLAASIAKQTP